MKKSTQDSKGSEQTDGSFFKKIETLSFSRDELVILDQRLLPSEKKLLRLNGYRDVGEAIQTLAIRGAPAIGVAASFGVYLGVRGIWKSLQNSYQEFYDEKDFFRQLEEILQFLSKTRPTAVNLFWALDRMKQTVHRLKGVTLPEIQEALYQEAVNIFEDDLARSRSIAFFGETFLKDGDRLLTHCNAGGLATSGYGTALAPIFLAHSKGKKLRVYVGETRPLLQGARLTAWELLEYGIDTVLIADNMSAHVMKTQSISAVLVGADRIALNGDTANKIGTYGLAIQAKEHGIPFYVFAPISTFDPNIATGSEIPIEERAKEELTEGFLGRRIAPEGVNVYSPAFDVTPQNYISALITETGILYPPFREKIEKLHRSTSF